MGKKKTDDTALDGKVETYFAENPKAKQVYTTSDGFLFVKKKYAIDHQVTLENDEEVRTWHNPDIIEEEVEETDTVNDEE